MSGAGQVPAWFGWLVASKKDTAAWEITSFDRYDEAALFFDAAAQQWSTVYFCRIAHCEGHPLDASALIVPFREEGARLALEQIKAHWFTQGGAAQFGPVADDANADEIVSGILEAVRKQVNAPTPVRVLDGAESRAKAALRAIAAAIQGHANTEAGNDALRRTLTELLDQWPYFTVGWSDAREKS